MRRQSIIHFILSLIVLVLGSCTLSMEEWVLPEEERGVHEPYTVKNDNIEVTYQYNEDVKPITKNVMEYFVASEADTILYFADNVRKDWIPEVGEIAAMGCNMEYPLGYSGRVVQSSKSNGMIRLVTTPVGRDDVFKELKYDFEAPVNTFDIPEDWGPEDYLAQADDDSINSPLRVRSVSRASMDDKVYIDYSLVKDECPELYEWQMKKHFPSRLDRQSRADNDKDVTEGIDEKENGEEVHKKLTITITSDAKVTFNFEANGRKFDVSDIDLSAIKAMLQKNKDQIKKIQEELDKDDPFYSATANFKFEYENTTTTTFYGRKDETVEENYKIEDSDDSYTFSIEYEGAGNKKFVKFPLSKHRDARDTDIENNNRLRRIDKLLSKVTGKKVSTPGVKLISFPKAVVFLGVAGLAIVFDAEIGFELGVSGAGTYTYKNKTWTKSGSRVIEGTKFSIDDFGPIINGHRISDRTGRLSRATHDVNFMGTLKAGLYVEASLLLAWMGAFSSGVKAKLAGGMEAALSSDNDIPGSFNDYATDKNYVKPYVTLAIDFVTEFSAFKIPIWGAAYHIFDEKDFCEDVKCNFEPTFPSDYKLLKAEFSNRDEGSFLEASYSLDGAGWNPLSQLYEPRILVYKKTTPRSHTFNWSDELAVFSAKPLIELKPSNYDGDLDAKKEYTFNGRVREAEKSGQYIVVPALCRPALGYYLFYPQYARVMDTGAPVLDVMYLAQTKGRVPTAQECDLWGVTVNPGYYYEFSVACHVTNGPKLRDITWEVGIYNGATGSQLLKDFVKSKMAFASGYYIYTFRFLYRPQKSSDLLVVYLNPKYKDRDGVVYTLDNIPELELKTDFGDDVKFPYDGNKEILNQLNSNNQ